MKINTEAYGGFIVSNNILNEVPTRYSFRNKSSFCQLNGWVLYSAADDDAYIKNGKNFIILSAESLFKIVPVMAELFDAPYGTHLYWLYENNVHIGFYDLMQKKRVTIKEILRIGDDI